ncbi:hypothetical protein [Tumebacillus permanentifrigoris]|uniref:Uncharacterized protein n=1 Tax=Tumebacillus permanentifrigoris TaxID=378543 RepID=A0A316DAH5_9BACL|nr:hypothetical protein [Tumebacillus permanentifrigoris]PWK14505.1 hypothetical protein C7459_105272 [Tumebacillus permanentifrigoris]
MQLDPKELLNLLKSLGVTYLYHANTVGTACTFLRNGGLLSRGGVASRGVFQTYQKSDDLDKEYGIWNDIFLDNFDIHQKRKIQNFYGPVLFIFHVDLLEINGLPPLCITKTNPTDWRNIDISDRYYTSIEELRNSPYSEGDYFRMITLRNTLSVLPFNPYLVQIFLDFPHIRTGEQPTLSHAYLALMQAASTGGIDTRKIVGRYCDDHCNCYTESSYGPTTKDRTIRRFFKLGT